MRIEVKVQPRSKQESIEAISETKLKVRIKAPAVEGRANAKLVEVLAEHFKVPRSHIQILKGEKSKNKLVEISPKKTPGASVNNSSREE